MRLMYVKKLKFYAASIALIAVWVLVAFIIRSDGNAINDINIGTYLDCRREPPEEYERLRRRVHSNAKNLWYFLKNELRQMTNRSKLEELKNIDEEIGNRMSSLLSDQEKMSESDGYHERRLQEAADVSSLIQRRLKHLQNPPDCMQARKIVCNLNKDCGFGCQLHHIVYCLISAYATERTLILNSTGWRYDKKGWEQSFLPLSETCISTYEEEVMPFSVTADAKILSLPIIDLLTQAQRPMFLPLAIPEDLAPRIKRFNGDPASWWIGQMLKYILKAQPSLQKLIDDTKTRLNFKSPIVGVHIRRTDKVGTEADFHTLHEYMTQVKNYYDKLELTRRVDERRVYLASDDARVLEGASMAYPHYRFFGNASIAKDASPDQRYTPGSLAGLLVDLHMLASCDYLVATFSSQVGRAAYEMMQSNRADASDRFFSLDEIYYFGGQNEHQRAAVMPHEAARNQISFQEKDLIAVAGNNQNGFGRGTNRRTNKTGLFPWYKTVDHLVTYQFPPYKQVPLVDDTRQTVLKYRSYRYFKDNN